MYSIGSRVGTYQAQTTEAMGGGMFLRSSSYALLKDYHKVWLGGSTLVDILISACMVTIVCPPHLETLMF